MTDSATMVQPASEILQETTPELPKRRGRPPGSKNKTSSGSSTSRRGRPKKSLEDKIGGTLTMLNLAFMFAPAEFRGDALDALEISALSKALNDAARENETLYKWLDAALGGTGSAMVNLAVVGVAIGARRMARHGIIVGAEWDDRLATFIAMNAGDVSQVALDLTQAMDAATEAANARNE